MFRIDLTYNIKFYTKLANSPTESDRLCLKGLLTQIQKGGVDDSLIKRESGFIVLEQCHHKIKIRMTGSQKGQIHTMKPIT